MDGSAWVWAPSKPRAWRAFLAAVVGPALVTLLAVPKENPPETVVAVLYVLAVVIAAGVGGAGAGLAASVLSFLTLNFFFTPPLHSFGVGTFAHLAALIVFLIASGIVGMLFSSAVSQRARAERREVETRLLNQLATRLLAGDEVEKVLAGFADDVCKTLSVGRCEITTSFTEPVVIPLDAPAGDVYSVELVAQGRNIGSMTIADPPAGAELDQDQRRTVDALAGQLAVALEAMRLSLEVRNAELEAEASRMKAALFSGVTHDVKTPLGAITTSVTSLLDGVGFSSEARREHLETIKQEAERLNRVVNNLLDLARVRAGALVPHKSPSPIDELMESVVGRLRPLLEGREVDIRLGDHLVDVPMDVVQVDQVLTNLVENAIKFSPEASPITLTAMGDSSGVRVTVSDKGTGIPKANLARVFEPFETGGEKNSGTGLGLAIARAIVAAHGGRIWASAAPGGGTAITFELPCAELSPVGV
ncbi:MAG: two-component system, OmpR family, sensor histidine kinase KdpD [Actinomycetota bacterium]|jgi:two-component system sensor histidine kinase KdpD|nr:two-component system, OmpR family, sensor histidine kinase KdpD [Actinomycetota bacterium]